MAAESFFEKLEKSRFLQLENFCMGGKKISGGLWEAKIASQAGLAGLRVAFADSYAIDGGK